MNIIDISNWTINEINNSINTFKDTSLTDIGMVNCDIESINIVGKVATATLWINEDVGTDGYTGTAPLKIYKEDKVEIKLNSPLLEGDSIEVHNGKLCHYHKMGMVVLDGSEVWGKSSTPGTTTCRFYTYINNIKLLNSNWESGVIKYSDKFKTNISCENSAIDNIETVSSTKDSYICINIKSIDNINAFKQWLQANPTTVIYELTEPHYEDITPLQSSIILKTFLESSMIINTNLPIETKLSYRTNVPSISTLSNRVIEVSESDNIIQNLIDIIDDEVDE